MSRLLFAFWLLCFSTFASCFPAAAQNKGQCHSLIVDGIDKMQRSQHVKSLELLSKARSIARKRGWPDEEFLAVNNIGANYYMLLEYGEALKHYLQAYVIATAKLEPKFEMIVLNNIAIVYSKEKKFDQAEAYFEKAYDIAKDNKDELKVGLYALNLGNVANEVGDAHKARQYFSEAIPLLKPQPDFETMARIGLAECDFSENKFAQARLSAQRVYDSIKNSDYKDGIVTALTIIAKSHLKQKQLSEAEHFLRKLQATRPNLETKVAIFELLSELHFRAKRYDKALAFKDSIIETNAQLEAIKNGKLLETNKAKFEIQNYQNELALQEARIADERRLFYWIIGIIALIVGLVVWSLRNRSIKHKQKKLIAERNEQILALELEKEKHEHLLREKQHQETQTFALLEQERLKNELESRNRKISAKALYLSGRNEMIEEVLSEMTKIPQLSADNALAMRVQSLKSHLKSDGHWNDFITHFEEVNHTFLSALKRKHADLNANDIRFLSYIYMNLSNKEIATMLNITAEACRKRKERLSSKMALPENVNLYDYLATL